MTASKTTVDWLRFRTQGEVLQTLEAVRALYGQQGELVSLRDWGRGKDGFATGATVALLDMPLGRVDFGGDSQRGWVRVNLTGKGCEWVTDWDAIEAVERLPASEVRRLDVALTTWSGEVTHEAVVAAHTAGRFSCGGRPPAMRFITSTDPNDGRTCYVGKRGSDKMFRGYEKGLQLAAQHPAMGLHSVGGHPIRDIYRCEVELQAETRPIPWEVVPRRDQYFAGAYPFLADVLPGVEADILMRRPERLPQLDLVEALAQCKRQFGGTLYTALHAYQGDVFAVWRQVVGQQHNPALLAAGVLLVDHEAAIEAGDGGGTPQVLSH
jgi:phage replication initiation protein